VLIEIARLLKSYPLNPTLGVDIILFDLEDYGPHNSTRTWGDEDFWALGSQHWARNMHVAGYRARFGILLDMVGASEPVFPREYYSQQYASWVLDKVWRRAGRLGFDHVFVNKPGPPINDDHLPINRIAGIPTINIIHLDTGSPNGSFFEHWHTLQDNMDNIDRETLRMVGTVVTAVVYEEQ
jgi:glutaminyl-peptide cyclotransferase